MEDTKLIVYCRPNHFSTLENFRVRKKLCDVTVIVSNLYYFNIYVNILKVENKTLIGNEIQSTEFIVCFELIQMIQDFVLCIGTHFLFGL